MKTIFFVGGGTLGPVTPLLAVYQELKVGTWFTSVQPGQTHSLPLRIVWIGTKHGPEREILKMFPEIIFEYLPESKLDRFISPRLLIAPLYFFAALVKSLVLIIRYRPSLVVGSGGFMQVPLMWVGRQCGVPCLIHQMDVLPTLSNRLCVWAAAKITVNFQETAKWFPKDKTVVTGNPVFIPPSPSRPSRDAGTGNRSSSAYEREELERLVSGSSKPLLVALGGGTGSEQVNKLVMLTADELIKMFHIVLISGGRDVGGRGGVYLRPRGAEEKPAPTTEGLIVTHFVHDTYHLLEKADLVVTRAGMGTLTELASLGKPAVIVPIPHSHQEANARYYERRRAAKVFWCDYDEVEKKAGEFVGFIKELWNDGKRREELADNMRTFYNSDAGKMITREIVAVLGKEYD